MCDGVYTLYPRSPIAVAALTLGRTYIAFLSMNIAVGAKLVFVNRFFYPDHSATSQMLTSLATALAGQGWDVHVVTSRLRYDDPEAALPARERISAVRVYRVWTSRYGRAWLPGRVLDYLTFYPSAAWRLWRLARRGDIVIAKTDPPMLSVAAAAVVRLRGARLVNWLQDIFPEIAQVLRMHLIDGVFARLLRRLRDWSLKGASANVVLGRRMLNHLLERGLDPKRISTIANWEAGNVIRSGAREADELRRDWSLGERFVVGYSGNMGRAHDFGIVLDAAERLKTTDVVFLWIGNGSQRSWLEHEARRRGLDSFLFKPYQPRERLAQSLSAPDAHLISLRPDMEGLIFPSKFYGILAAGRPSLFLGDPEGDVAAELYKHRCGYSIAPGDADALASRILHLSENTENCRAMGERARHAFITLYDEQLAVERWARLLRDIADAPSGR